MVDNQSSLKDAFSAISKVQEEIQSLNPRVVPSGSIWKLSFKGDKKLARRKQYEMGKIVMKGPEPIVCGTRNLLNFEDTIELLEFSGNAPSSTTMKEIISGLEKKSKWKCDTCSIEEDAPTSRDIPSETGCWSVLPVLKFKPAKELIILQAIQLRCPSCTRLSYLNPLTAYVVQTVVKQMPGMDKLRTGASYINLGFANHTIESLEQALQSPIQLTINYVNTLWTAIESLDIKWMVETNKSFQINNNNLMKLLRQHYNLLFN